jgi:hypothetical protein
VIQEQDGSLYNFPMKLQGGRRPSFWYHEKMTGEAPAPVDKMNRGQLSTQTQLALMGSTCLLKSTVLRKENGVSTCSPKDKAPP